MNLLAPFNNTDIAFAVMDSYIGYAGVVFMLRAHELTADGQRIVEYRAGFTQDQEATTSLLDENDCWANPLLDGQRVDYLWRLVIPNTEKDLLAALNQLYKNCCEHRVTDESPSTLRHRR